uniref:Syntaxin binding protein 3 n=1 Tax=Propithecus coquereli TaxID=379532 RepID=A0A2K6EJ21_PROCO
MAPPVTERGLKSVVWQSECAGVGAERAKIMLLDEFTTKLLASCCKMTDLLEEGITVVENIYKNREPVRQMKALYFITPTSKVSILIFSTIVMTSCSKSIRRCKEINISFIPHESQVYTLDVPDAFYYCYSPDPSNANGKDAIMEAMAEQIVTVCATLDENPGVRYKSKPLDNASKLSQLVEKKLEEYYKIDEKSPIKVMYERQVVTMHKVYLTSLQVSNSWPQAILLPQLPKVHEPPCLAEIFHLLIQTSLSALAQLMKKMPHFRKQITKVSRTTEENLDRLIQNVKIENESDMIRNWSYLGVPIVPQSQQGKPTRKDRSTEETFQLSRWTPFIKDIMEDAIDNRLDSKEWPYCSQCPAVWNGSGAVSARQKPRANYLEDRKNGSKLIVFVIGGITYSEMRCAYEVSQAHKSCEVIIGSTHILTPKKLLDDIKMLNKPKDKVSFFKDE